MAASAISWICIGLALATVVDRCQGVWNGQKLQANTWPWMVSLEYLHGEKYHSECVGTLVHRQWVLTASQCLYSRGDISKWRAVLGENDLLKPEDGEQTIDIEMKQKKVINSIYRPHSTIRGTGLLLFKLKKPADITSKVELLPVTIPKTADVYKNCMVAGWMNDFVKLYLEGKGKDPRLPLFTRVTKTSTQACLKQYENFPPKQHEMCFTSATSAWPCMSDRGAPLVCYQSTGERYLVGMAANTDCNSPTIPAKLYNDVIGLKDWIDNTIKANTDDASVG